MKVIKNKNLLISILLCIAITGLCIYLYYPIEGTPGLLFVITWILHFAFLILGPILFVFRISGFMRRENFFYAFVSVSNMWIGVFLYFLYFIHKVDAVVFWEFLPNILMGVLLLSDIYWVRTTQANTRSK